MRAGEVDKVVIGVGNDIDCEFTYVVKEMDVDLGEFWHDLSVEARAVLAELVAEPANKEAIHRFQELLVASRQRDPHLVTELPAAGRVELDVGTCRVCVVVDDHRHIPVRRRPVIASTTLPLADVLKSNDRWCACSPRRAPVREERTRGAEQGADGAVPRSLSARAELGWLSSAACSTCRRPR